MGLVERVLAQRSSHTNGQNATNDNGSSSSNNNGASFTGKYPIVFCTHPPVVTLGRGTKSDDIFDWHGEIVEVSRGGRATYHGPNQLVIYPIIDLNDLNIDLHHYLRTLENAVIAALAELGVHNAEARTVKADKNSPSLTGVWAGSRKVGSIGIAVRRGVSYHGVAVNLHKDESAFRGINPCGFRAEVMASVQELRQTPEGTDAPLGIDDQQRFQRQFVLTLEQQMIK
jgi:lipoyl(octanoyl) transferase